MMTNLAIDGGVPVRTDLLPYGRQQIDVDDIAAVTAVLESDWLTTGPKINEFECAFAQAVHTQAAVAVSNGTAALHAAMNAINIGPGDEVIVSPMTFAASANCVIFQGARPVFADVDSDTLLLDPAAVKAKISPNTKAIIAVDYAGHPCDYDALHTLAQQHNLVLVDDACHAIGGSYKKRPVGSLAHLNTFSLHPVKHLTTGEGGVITTDNPAWTQKMRAFRNHGLTTDHRQRAEQGSWFYEMVELGYNYRLTDFQCALGLNQLRKLPGWVKRRQEIATLYNAAFADVATVTPLVVNSNVSHAYHLYVIKLELDMLHADRAEIFAALRAEGIGVNVHYIPVHLHPYYRKQFGTGPGLCSVAEDAYEKIITLPVFPNMDDNDANDVIEAVVKVIKAYQR